MKYKNDQTSKHCTVWRVAGTFQREAGRGNTTGREPLRREVRTLLPSSFWQNVYPVPSPLAFYCEIWKKKRQFLTIRHKVRKYLKRRKDYDEGKREEFWRAQHCWRISCLLTLHLWFSLIKPLWIDVCCRYQVPSTPATDKSRRVRSYIWGGTNNEEGHPKPSAVSGSCFPSAYLNAVISSANGRKI